MTLSEVLSYVNDLSALDGKDRTAKEGFDDAMSLVDKHFTLWDYNTILKINRPFDPQSEYDVGSKEVLRCVFRLQMFYDAIAQAEEEKKKKESNKKQKEWVEINDWTSRN